MKYPDPTPVEPEPPVEPEQRYPFHIDGILFYPTESELPTDICIKSGRAPVATVTQSIRHAKSLATWYLPCPKVEIALSKKHLDDHRVAHALTYSLLGLGLLLVVVGAATLSFVTLGIGLVTAVLSGVFRARASIQGWNRGEGIYQIAGAHDSYIHRLPEHEVVTGEPGRDVE